MTKRISDRRLNQLANDPGICNISDEVKLALLELLELRAEIKKLRWLNGQGTEEPEPDVAKDGQVTVSYVKREPGDCPCCGYPHCGHNHPERQPAKDEHDMLYGGPREPQEPIEIGGAGIREIRDGSSYVSREERQHEKPNE
jgi:hypothetical protein